MSFYEAASLIVWIISSAAVVISLYQVNRQTRIFSQQTEYVARSLLDSTMESLNNQSRDITRMFLEYPEMRPYFYEGKSIEPGHPDYHRAETIAELILDIFWTMSNQARRTEVIDTPEAEAGKRLWDDFVADSFTMSPIMVKTALRRQSWYGQEIVDMMNEALSRGKSAAPSA